MIHLHAGGLAASGNTWLSAFYPQIFRKGQFTIECGETVCENDQTWEDDDNAGGNDDYYDIFGWSIRRHPPAGEAEAGGERMIGRGGESICAGILYRCSADEQRRQTHAFKDTCDDSMIPCSFAEQKDLVAPSRFPPQNGWADYGWTGRLNGWTDKPTITEASAAAAAVFYNA